MNPERSGARVADEIPVRGHGGPVRHICLCADDYGISPAVNAAIRELLAAGRINATSVMVVAPAFDASEARALAEITLSRRIQTGLHLTLTAPFRPLSEASGLIVQGSFPRLPLVIMAAAGRAVSRRGLAAEIAAQLRAFAAAFGRPPDFVDGHQHVQLLPRIRDAILTEVKRAAPPPGYDNAAAWYRGHGAWTIPRACSSTGSAADSGAGHVLRGSSPIRPLRGLMASRRTPILPRCFPAFWTACRTVVS